MIDWPPDALVVHAAARPGGEAVVDPDGAVSYARLAERAAEVASALAAGGVVAEAGVGVLARRSWELVAAACGILGAGAAFLLLDPTHPAARLQHLLDDAGASTLLGHGPLLQGSGLLAPNVIELERLPGERAAPPRVQPDAGAAYLIYTSGSTGEPKGVVIDRGGLRNLLREELTSTGMAAADRMLHFASVAFDAAVWEILGAVCAGASLAIYPRETPDVEVLGAFIRRHRVTTALLPPPVLRLLEPAGVPSLRTLVTGGEACTPDIVERWDAPGRRLLNAYGPAETAIVATIDECRSGEGAPPIGLPLPGLHANVVDDRFVERRTGEAGELLIGGAGVGRCYVGRPDLTAERFVPDPFGAPGGRAYRTGDVCLRRGDRRLEFVGRVDAQVKLRGQRVELGEVEMALRGAPGLLDAAVAAVAGPAGDPRLAAYVVPRPGRLPGVTTMREHLSTTLPDFMVPSLFVALDALPLNASGKVDRGALPAPAGDRLLRDATGGAPTTATEQVVAEVWSEVLGVQRPGRDDDFLAVGGDSLAAARVAGRLEARLGRAVDAATVLAGGGLAALAARIDRTTGEPGWPRITPTDRSRPVGPTSFAQERLLFLHRLAPLDRAYQTACSIRLRGPLRVPALRSALADTARRHEILRTTFGWRDGEAVQIVHDPSPVPLPEIDLSHLAAPERERTFDEHVRRLLDVRLDPERPPLTRWTLIRLLPAEHVLLLVEHHLLHDGWSFRVVLRDLLLAYRHRIGQGPAPEELGLQFRDVAAWQRRHVGGEVEARQLSFWRAQLEGGTATALPVPPAGPDRAAGGEAIAVSVPPALVEAAVRLSRERGATLFATLFAAFSGLLHRLTGDDVAVGTMVANRRRAESEGVAGMLVNSLVLRTRLRGEATFLDHLEQARQVVTAAMANQDVPFQRVVEAMRPSRPGPTNPLFRIAFSLDDAPLDLTRPDGLEVSVAPDLPNGSAKFDLSLTLVPGPVRERVATLGGFLEYDIRALDRRVAEELWESYLAFTAAALEAPRSRLRELPLLSAAQAQRVGRFRGTAAVALRGGRPVDEVWRRRPDAVALVDAEGPVSYRELTASADDLAARLRGLGVGPGSPVGVRMEPSVELVRAALAIWRAGGVYVPLDPTAPAERERDMREDAGVGLVLGAHDRLDGAVGPSQLAADVAYVLFTSGSTGRPKGVAVTHANLGSLYRALSDRLGADGEDETWLAATSPAFDISLVEFLWPLTRGARVAVRARGGAPEVSLAFRSRDARSAVGAAAEQGFHAVWLLGDGQGDPGEHEVAVLTRTDAGPPSWSQGACALAGRRGANLLVHLVGRPVDGLRGRIAAYRSARRAAGLIGPGKVTVILPTLLTDHGAEAAYRGYLVAEAARMGLRPEQAELAFQRSRGLALLGSPARAEEVLDALGRIGVDEVACLVDWSADGVAVPGLRGLAAAARRRRSPADAISGAVLERGVTHLQCTPSMARLLLATPQGRRALAGLRLLLLGGEPLAAELAAELAERMPAATISNGYGPTETTVYATLADVGAELRLQPAGPVSIGRPLANTTVVVADRRLQPLPPGFTGELWVGGQGVSGGYVGRPGETAERFLPDPWSDERGGLLYRTGDVAWLLPDGRLGFLGRVDRQVKLHGYRVELNEVEQALSRHPAVESAVAVLDGRGGEPVLVAAVAGRTVDTEELGEHVRRLLPAYMVPSRFQVVASMPLTGSGKVDLRAVARLVAGDEAEAALPAPAEQLPAGEGTAHLVREAWTRVLRRRDLSPDVDFFAAGGHSLLALRMSDSLGERLGVEVPLSLVFESPRLGDVARRLEALGR